MLQGINELSEPGTGYLWAQAARQRISYRDYGEFASGHWCYTRPEDADFTEMPALPPQACRQKSISKGEPLPADLGEPRGSASPYPWKVPVLAGVAPHKRELVGHTAERFAPWSLDFPDQLRADQFLNEFAEFVRARQAGHDTMPALMIMHLPNDHTAGTGEGKPKPEAMVADNDLALGRMVDAISHSLYWDDTAILVLEDDAQNGPDHVDAHRSIALVISKYSPAPRPSAEAFVDHSFYTTVHMIRTIEALLGLEPMNHNDARVAPMAPLFSGNGSQPAFSADYRNRDNGLLYQMNPPKAAGSAASRRLDFSRPDAADSATLNRVLWRAAKGSRPMPKPKHTVFPEGDD